MPYNNISAIIDDNQMTRILTAIETIQTELPFLVQLTKEERMTLLKMGEGSINFVNKSMDYARSHPQFAPPYMDRAEFRSDVELSHRLIRILQFLHPLLIAIEDTSMAVGNEAFTAALQYYNTVKYARSANAPGADGVYQDLRQRFPRGGVSTSPEPETDPEPDLPEA